MEVTAKVLEILSQHFRLGGNTIRLVAIYCLSALRVRAITLVVTGCVSALPRARACTLLFTLFNGKG